MEDGRTEPSYFWGKVLNIVGISVGILCVLAGALLAVASRLVDPQMLEMPVWKYWALVAFLFAFGVFEIKLSYDAYNRRPYTWMALLLLFGAFAVYSVVGLFVEAGWRRWSHLFDLTVCVASFIYFYRRKVLFSR